MLPLLYHTLFPTNFTCAGFVGHLFSHLEFYTSLNKLSCQSTRQKSTIQTA